MTVTITKPKNKTPLKTKAGTKSVQTRIAELVDTVAGLIEECKAVKLDPRFEALSDAKGELLGLLDDSVDAADDGVRDGEAWRCQFGAKGNVRSITDINRVFELMGSDVFTQVCSVPLKYVDAYLTPDEIKKVTKSERTLDRVLKFKPIK